MSEKPITQTRLQLFAHGYVDLLPIEGKRPPMEKWSQRPATNVEEIKLWPRSYPYAKNTGCLTRAMPTLDLDILNEEAAIAAEDLVRNLFEERGHVLLRIGRPPKRAIPFRTNPNEPFPKITANFEGTDEKIELLSNGQQVVLYGLHPATGKPYNWPRGAPTDIDRDDLPYIHEAEAQQLVDDIAELLAREFGYVRAQSRPKSNGANGAAADDDWKFLLDNIHHGRALHESIRDLAAKMLKSGTQPGAAVNQLRALMEASTAPRDDRWQARYADIPRAVASAEKFRQAPHPEPEPEPKPEPPPQDAYWSNDQRQQKQRSRFVLKPFTHITASTAPSYLVKGILPRVGLVVVWGPPKCGKSFWTYDLVMHVAIGRSYRERKVQQGTVVYCALEGGTGFAGRVEAWRRLRLAEHDQAVPFYLLDVPLNLVADHAALIQSVRLQISGNPAVVVIDTLNRAMPGDENKPDDMSKFIRAADAIRLAFNCLVVIVHHCGVANNRPRGHTALAGADDAQIAVERDKDGTHPGHGRAHEGRRSRRRAHQHSRSGRARHGYRRRPNLVLRHQPSRRVVSRTQAHKGAALRLRPVATPDQHRGHRSPRRGPAPRRHSRLPRRDVAGAVLCRLPRRQAGRQAEGVRPSPPRPRRETGGRHLGQVRLDQPGQPGQFLILKMSGTRRP